ncbi:hypothetical protein ACLB1E_06635 [Escherichia coli]
MPELESVFLMPSKQRAVHLFIVGERGGAPSGRCHRSAGERPSGADGEVSVVFMPDGTPIRRTNYFWHCRQ